MINSSSALSNNPPLRNPSTSGADHQSRNTAMVIITLPRLGIASLLVAVLVLWSMVADYPRSPSEYQIALLLSLASILIVIWTSVRTIDRAGASGMVHVVFLSTLVTLMSVSSILLSLLKPSLTYNTRLGSIEFLRDPIRVQMAVLCFVVSYSLATLIPNSRVSIEVVKQRLLNDIPRMFSPVLVLVSGMHVLLLTLSVPSVISFGLNASRNYLTPLLLIVGMRWSIASRREKTFIVSILILLSMVNLVNNSRGYAIYPFLYLFAGYIVAPGVPSRRKQAIATLCIVSLPLVLLLGNQSRAILGPIGTSATFGERADAIQSVVASRELISENGPIVDMAARFYPKGGNAIISMTPERYTFIGIHPELVTQEAIWNFLPSAVSGLGQIDQMTYTGSTPLIRYGLIVNQFSSVEINIVGSLYLIGGIVSVIIGGFLVGGLFQGSVAIISLVILRSGLGLVLLAATVGTALDAPNRDMISIMSTLVWSWLVCGAFYVFMWIVTGSKRQSNVWLSSDKE